MGTLLTSGSCHAEISLCSCVMVFQTKLNLSELTSKSLKF